MQYARCLAAGKATNLLTDSLGGLACGFYEEACALACLYPFGRKPKLGKPRKSSPPSGSKNSGNSGSCGCQGNSFPAFPSFPASTLVHTKEGIKPIEEIKIGDQVLSYNENTETLSYQPVTDLIQGERQYRLVEITLDSGKSIETTAEHPFYIKGKGWNPAGSLSVGQVLELHDGTIVVVKEIDTSVRRELVYNFTVANTHNYLVGQNGVLVHNSTGLQWNNGCLGPNDLNWRGRGTSGQAEKEALDEAFKRTGQKREDFTPTKWGTNWYGKTVPVEWRGPNYAEVNRDYPHKPAYDRKGNWATGPDAPHVGWQVGKKATKEVGHILLDDVSCGKLSDK